MNLPAYVKQKRLEKRLSQQALADAAGLHVRSIQRLEKGQLNPRGYTLQRLSKILELNLNELEPENHVDEQVIRKLRSIMYISVISYVVIPLGNLLMPWLIYHYYQGQQSKIYKNLRLIIISQLSLYVLTFILFPLYIANKIHANPLAELWLYLLIMIHGLNLLVYMSLSFVNFLNQKIASASHAKIA